MDTVEKYTADDIVAMIAVEEVHTMTSEDDFSTAAICLMFTHLAANMSLMQAGKLPLCSLCRGVADEHPHILS
jgi:hypothetical protein